jgi:hypothetical protein
MNDDPFVYNINDYPTFFYKPSASELRFFYTHLKEQKIKFYKELRKRGDMDPNEIVVLEWGNMTVAEFCLVLTKLYHPKFSFCS